MMNKLKLGDRISVNKMLVRKSININGINCVNIYIPQHIKKEWIEVFLFETIEAIVIGKRTLRNGTVEFRNDIGSVFTSTGSVQAYLVVKDMNTKPFYVLRDE